MATTTRSVIRTRVAENLGDLISVTTSGSGSTTTFVATTLKNFAPGTDCDGYSNFDALITKTTHDAYGEIRRVKLDCGYAASTTTVTVESAYSAAINGCTCVELYRRPVDVYNQAITQAIRESQWDGTLYKALRDETIVIDNRLSNSDFETFSSTFTGWTYCGSPTVTKETSIVMHGCSSAKVVNTGGTDKLLQCIGTTLPMSEITDKSAQSKFWVYATCACSARIGIDLGTSTTYSGYHSGSNQWELLDVDVTLGSCATKVQQVLEIAAGKTVYFDAGWLKVGRICQYDLPSCFTSVSHIWEQGNEKRFTDGDWVKPGDFKSGTRLRIEGRGQLSTSSTDAGTVEVGSPQACYIATLATRNVARIMMHEGAGMQRDENFQDINYWNSEAQKARISRDIPMRKLGVSRYYGSVRIEEDACGKKIVITR